VQEHGAQVITTTPTVPYIFEYSDGRCVYVSAIGTVWVQYVVGVEYEKQGIRMKTLSSILA
jgi:hypothetical protein